MWGGYGTGGMVVQSWTDNNSQSWRLFDQQASKHGKPTAVWVQICIFSNGATYDEVKKLIANTRSHSAADVKIYITGQPLYDSGHKCTLAGPTGPEDTDALAKKAAADPAVNQNVVYPGSFLLKAANELADVCHANSAGQQSLGKQAKAFWN